jgi:hypothetical protein
LKSEEFRIGRTNADQVLPAPARRNAEAADMQQVLSQLLGLGCSPAGSRRRELGTGRARPLRPRGFLLHHQHPDLVRLAGQWVAAENQRMDAMIVVEGASRRMPQAARSQEGDRVVVGMRGIRVVPESKERDRLAFRLHEQ